MDHAAKERYSAEGVIGQKQAIKVTDEWFDELQKMPFTSCKCFYYFISNLVLNIEKKGKTLHLLKATSKKIPERKKRKIVPLLGTIKDYFNTTPSQSVA